MRSWLSSNWLELLISALVAAVEAAIIAPWLALLVGWGDGAGFEPALPVGVGLIGLASFWSGRIFLLSGWDMAASRMLSLAIWLVMLVVWFGVVAGAGIGAPLTFIDQLFRLDRLAFGLLFLGGVAWWRGLWLASTDDIFSADFTRATTVRMVVALGLALGVLSFVSGEVRNLVFDVAVVAVPVGVVCSLIAATAVQVRQARRQVRPSPEQGRGGIGWLGAGASIALLVLVVAGLLSGTAGREIWRRLVWPIEIAAGGLEFILTWALLLLAYAVFMLLYPFLWLFRRLASPPEEETEAQEFAPAALPEFAEQTQDALPAFVVQALQVAIVVAVVTLIAWLALRSLRRYRALAGDEEQDEVRESVFSRDAMMDDLSALWRSMRPRWSGGNRRPRIDLDAPPTTVRDAYRYVLVLAGRQGRPREPRETPADYATRLEAGDATLTEPLDDLTRRYLRERYGDQIDDADLAAARDDWFAIRQRLEQRP